MCGTVRIVLSFGGCMDTKRMRQVIEIYRKKFEEATVEKHEFPHGQKLDEPWHGLEHCYAMLDKMEVFLREGELEKVDRWLGFVQGYLWAQQFYTIDEFRHHNLFGEEKKV